MKIFVTTSIILLGRLVVVGVIVLALAWEGFRIWEEWDSLKAKS